MPHGLRGRLWVESILASATGILAIVTIFWQDWIEAVFGVDPDHGNGLAEWAAVAILALAAAAFAASARIEWRHSQNQHVAEH